jgi:hypothetical protein
MRIHQNLSADLPQGRSEPTLTDAAILLNVSIGTDRV